MNRLRYRRRIVASLLALGCLASVGISASSAKAQQGSVPLYHENLPPGAIGHLQHMKGRGITGYFQPVEIIAPEGVQISLVVDGQFGADEPAPVKFGCLIGGVYRFRVSGIPLQEGRELFPSVEVIDRLYPPAGLELKHPIPVHLTAEEMALALDGKFVTRVIYLEPPRDALPIQQEREVLPYFEVAAGADPIQVADDLGRPVAILRIGSRAPILDDPEPGFSFSPPIMLYSSESAHQAALETQAVLPEGLNTQRQAVEGNWNSDRQTWVSERQPATQNSAQPPARR
ncbi:MAG: hypothetical protein WDZ51_18460 [Pirellulaceae bacterium]